MFRLNDNDADADDDEPFFVSDPYRKYDVTMGLLHHFALVMILVHNIHLLFENFFVRFLVNQNYN